MTRPIHILTTDKTAEAVVAELSRVGQSGTWGEDVQPGAEYALIPTGRIGRTPPADLARHILDNLQRARAKREKVHLSRDFTFTDFWGDVPADLRKAREVVRQQEKMVPDYARRDRRVVIDRCIKIPTASVVTPPAPQPKPAMITAPPAPKGVPVPSGRPIIVHVMPWDLTVGGGQRMLDDWCREQGRYWDVHIVTGGIAPGLWPFSGATIHLARSAQELQDLCSWIRPDVVVTHNSDHHMPRGAACFPQVWYAHGVKIINDPRPNWGHPASYVCNFPQPPHETWGDIPRSVVRLGVDTGMFHPGAHEARSHLVVGIVGRLSPEKVPETFVRELHDWKPGPWRVRFVGEGIKNHYQNWVRDILHGLSWVEFAGDITPSEMPAAYHDLDAVLIPSESETGSYAMVEALASGVPVICRDIPGPQFASGGNAIFRSTDADLLGALHGLEDGDNRRALGLAGQKWASENLSISRQAGRLSAVYAAAAAPRVSVVMPVWNTPPAFLREAVESVQKQTEPLWELVIVDDGSDHEDTRLELNMLAGGDPRIRVHRLGHRGISATLNFGLHVSRCDLVARMDADDIMYPERLEKQVAYLRANPRVDMVGTQMSWSHMAGTTQHAAVVDMEVLLKRDFLLNHPTVMFRRHVIEGLGGYDESMGCVEDFDLWCRMIRAKRVIHNLPDVLLRYRQHGGQITRRNDVSAIACQIRARHDIPQLPASGLGAVFDTIYTKGLWGAPMSSGRGSTPESTAELRRILPSLLSRFHVTSVLDAGCGASTWMRQAVPGSVKKYIGLDVSPVIVDANRKLPAKPGWEFRVGDISNGKVPETVDLIVCRDVLTHLPNANVMHALCNAKAAARLLLTTHWPDRENKDIRAGDWRPLNLEAAPFHMPPPMKRIAEVDEGKFLALFDLSGWKPPEK